MFLLGAFALLAQVLLTRELFIIFFGNELTIGLVFGVWLSCVGLGSLAGRRMAATAESRTLEYVAAGGLIALAALLPALLLTARSLRLWLTVPIGGMPSIGVLLACVALMLGPLCLVVGLLFPCLCRLAERDASQGVRRLYIAESLGSLAAGLLFTFLLAGRLPPLACAALAGAAALLGACILARGIAGRAALAFLAAALALSAPRVMAPLEEWGAGLRWNGFGVTGPGLDSRLLLSRDTPYQNLAVIENEGQRAVYGNGQVLFAFPDQMAAEHKLRFIMAQKPDARRVLLIGGNPADDPPELLKHPIERLDHVELDPAILRLPGVADSPAAGDPRLRRHAVDGPRFVRDCREAYDLVIVEAPAPMTASLNRFHTADFFRGLRRILRPGGVLATGVESSEHLQDEAADLGAGVYRSLQSVFPRVKVAAGSFNRFLAGDGSAPITLDRETLAARSRAAGVPAKYFRPEYFLTAEETDPVRVARVEARLASARGAVNTAARPSAYFYNLLLWSRYSNSGVDGVLRALERASPAGMAFSIGAAAILLALAGRLWRRRRPGAAGALGNAAVAFVLFTGGLCGIAMELILIFLYQSAYGFVYDRMGLVIAMFMLGLAAGAWAAGPRRESEAAATWRKLALLEALFAAFALAVGALAAVGMGAGGEYWSGLEILLLALVAGTGALVGAQFALAARALVFAGRRPAAAAATANAADLLGAAAGSLLAGLLFLPLLGPAVACMLLSALKAAGLLGLLAFRPAPAAALQARLSAGS